MCAHAAEVDSCLDHLINALIDQLNTFPADQRTGSALIAAARVLEYAAYEMAQSDEARHVARLILLAADMERTAGELRVRH